MEKVKRFFKELNENRKYQVVFFIVSMCVVLGLYGGISFKIAYEDVTTVVEDKNLIKHIDEVKKIDDKLVVSGWCLYNGADSNKYKIKMFLRNIENEKDIIWLDVSEIERIDIDSYFDCEVDYKQTGFEANKNLRKLSLEGKTYEIVLVLKFSLNEVEDLRGKERVTESRSIKTVSTKRYLVNGTLSAYEDKESEPSKTSSEELNEVFENGQLLAFRADYDIYIYQYKRKIYWIAGAKYHFEEDGETYVQCHINTARIDKLPIHRIEYKFDNISFYFERNEIQEDTVPYRVAVCDIPTDYPITDVRVGYRVDMKWIWEEYINMDIQMLNDI